MNRIRPQRTLIGPRNIIAARQDIARQHEHYAQIYQRSYSEALRASGIQGQVYAALTGGVKCTCFMEASVLDDDGNMSDRAINEVLERHVRSSSTEPKPDTRRIYKAVDLDLDIDVPDYATLELADDDLDDYETLEDINPGYGQNRCGICFGTGYVGGYQIANGHRSVVDTQTDPMLSQHYELVTSEQPHELRYVGEADSSGNLPLGTVTFTLTVPKQATQHLATVRVWNNDCPLDTTDYSLIWRTERGNSTTLDGWLLDMTSDTCQATVISNKTLTHLELQFVFANEDNVQWLDMPQVPAAMFEPDLLGQRVTATLNLPHSAGANNRSIVRESKFGRTWQLSEVTPHYDNKGIVAFVEAEARLVGQNEVFNLLPGF